MDLEVKTELYNIINQINSRSLDGYDDNSELFAADEDISKIRNMYSFPMPKKNRSNWYRAMRYLELNGVLYFWITDKDKNGVKLDFTPEESEEELYCTVDTFYRPKFLEFCKENNIDLSKPFKATHSARLVILKDNVLSVEIDDSERLVYKKLRAGMALNILRCAQYLKNGRGKRFDEAELRRLDKIQDFHERIMVKPLSFNVNSFTDFFKGDLLKNVVEKIIDVRPNWVSVPESKDIDIATYLDIRDRASKIEKL